MKLPVDTHTLRRLTSGRITFPSEHENINVLQARNTQTDQRVALGFYHMAVILSPEGLKTFGLLP